MRRWTLPLPALLDTKNSTCHHPLQQSHPTVPAVPRALTHLCLLVLLWGPVETDHPASAKDKMTQDRKRLLGSQRGQCWLWMDSSRSVQCLRGG